MATQTLADNGGPTQTLKLEEGSIALASTTTGIPYGSSPYWNDSPTTDQRGVARTAAQNTSIGAYSANYVPPPMSLEYNTNLSSGTTITLPLYGTVNVTVDWGDSGPTDNYTSTGDVTHTYASEGTYTVSISGTLTVFGKNDQTYDNVDKFLLQVSEM